MPAVEGPITGGKYGVPYLVLPPEVLEESGWVEEEFFISGDAGSFTSDGELTGDGNWSVEPGATAPYKTRIVVRRPPAEKFSGTVVVEWLNVTLGRDSDSDWIYLAPYLMREGIAYVGVSTQKSGIDGGAAIEVSGIDPALLAPLKQWDSERYGDLTHPGDDYSYDLFTQAGRLVRAGGDVMDGLDVRQVVAAGESQSATRLTTYLNAVQPETQLFDGFLLQGRGGAPSPLSAGSAPIPAAATVRTDLDQPVLQVESETDLTLLGFRNARQPDSASISTWEIAGTAHVDNSILASARASGEVWFDGADVDFDELCGGPVNRGPLSQVLRAGLHSLLRWMDDGTAPPDADDLELTADGAALAVDDLGIALGGIRTPAVDAPNVLLSGAPRPSGGALCSLFGQTNELPAGTLDKLYDSHDDYVVAVRRSAQQAYEAGFLLPEERDEFVQQAEAAEVP